ncbi:hypothetical protein ABEF95_007502 [Exophiala dermatitidis]
MSDHEQLVSSGNEQDPDRRSPPPESGVTANAETATSSSQVDIHDAANALASLQLEAGNSFDQSTDVTAPPGDAPSADMFKEVNDIINGLMVGTTVNLRRIKLSTVELLERLQQCASDERKDLEFVVADFLLKSGVYRRRLTEDEDPKELACWEYTRKLRDQMCDDLTTFTLAWTELAAEMARQLLGEDAYQKIASAEDNEAEYERTTNELVDKVLGIILPARKKYLDAQNEDNQAKQGDNDVEGGGGDSSTPTRGAEP